MDRQKLWLIPMPRLVGEKDGTCPFHSGERIALGQADVNLFRSARRAQTALLERAGISTCIVVDETNSPGNVAISLTIAPDRVPEEQGYILDITTDRVDVVGHDAPGVFYGICTLNQLIRQFGAELPCLSISDYPDFPVRGLMLDISRSKVPTLQTLFALVDLLAGLKINQFQLYMEHTFAYRDHPEVWAGASPLTGQDILELDLYCRERFVDLVPNQNSLGHLVPWLTHPRYADLAEAPDGFEWPWGGRSDGPFSLNPTDPRSLELLCSMYDDLLPHFSSSLFNVGCDETFDLGKGRSKTVCDERGTHRVYLDFVLQIHKLVRERGRKMMFWGDIILHEPALIPELPKDIIALEWGYEYDHPFDKNCEKFASAGVPFYVCPGTSSWNAVAGRTDNAMDNLRRAAENGLKHGAVGYLNTDWGDNGHWQYQPTAYLGYAYGAAVSWALQANADIDLPEALSLHAFDDPTGEMGRVAFDLGNVYKVYERVTAQRIHNASFLVQVLYAPIEELESRWVNWEHVNPQVFVEAQRAIDAAMALLPKAQMGGNEASLIRREYQNAARLLRHACELGEFKVALAQAGSSAEKAGLAVQANALAEDMRVILAEHRELWLARNRVSGLEEKSGLHFQKMIDTYRRMAQEIVEK